MKLILLPALALTATLLTGCVDDGVGIVSVRSGPGYYHGPGYYGGAYYSREDVYVRDYPRYRGDYDRRVAVNDTTNVTRINRTTNVSNVNINRNKRVVNNSQPTVVVKKKKKGHKGDDRDPRARRDQ